MTALKVSYNTLRRSLGLFLGTGRDYTAWSSQVAADADEIIGAGLRNFYWPIIEGGQPAYVWSFLRQPTTLSLSSGTRTYNLASDFGGLLSGLDLGTGSLQLRLEQIPEEDVRAMY